MKEIRGELWDYYGKSYTVICITTNGFVKKNGDAVMGRGCAKEAAQRFPKIQAILGDLIKTNGNIVFEPVKGVYTFPVKHNWWEKADLLLIAQSAQFIKDRAQSNDRIQNRSKTVAQEQKKTKSDHVKVEKEKADANYATIVRNQYEWFERLADRIDANPKPRPAGAERP